MQNATTDPIVAGNPRRHTQYNLTSDLPGAPPRWMWAVDVEVGSGDDLVAGSVLLHRDTGSWRVGSMVSGAWTGGLEDLVLARDPSDLADRIEAAARAVLSRVPEAS